MTKTSARTFATFINRNHPYFAHLFLTRKCNLKCLMCHVWETPSPELDKEGFFKIIERLDRLGVGIIQLTGGEPFLREDLADIIVSIKNRGLIASVSTNGTLPLSAYERIVDTPVDGIAVSLHSASPAVHEEINGMPGSWEKAVRTIRFLKERGKSIYVCCVVSSLNLKGSPDIVKFCEDELGVPIGLQPAVLGGDASYFFRGKNASLKGVAYDDVKRTLRDVRILSMRRGRTFMKKSFRVLSGLDVAWNCRAGRMFFAVMPDGRFGICQDLLTDFNILDEDFMEAFKTKKFRKMAKAMVDRCPHCVYSCYYDQTLLFAKPWEALSIGLRTRRFHSLRNRKSRMSRCDTHREGNARSRSGRP